MINQEDTNDQAYLLHKDAYAPRLIETYEWNIRPLQC